MINSLAKIYPRKSDSDAGANPNNSHVLPLVVEPHTGSNSGMGTGLPGLGGGGGIGTAGSAFSSGQQTPQREI